MKLPSGVKLHNVTTGKTSKAGEAVEISGGTKFYLSAPLTQVQDVAGSWSATMKGSVTKDYSAYKISTGSGSQDLALVFGEGVDDEKYVDFKVTWVQYASVKVIKKDAKANAKLSGAVFGLYSDANCTKLITKLPATDETGVAKLTDLPLGKYYVKEKETANGYVLDGETREVDLTYRDQNTAEVTYSADWQNKRQKAEVKVLKKAKDSDRVLEGAVFALCNKDDIVNARRNKISAG